MKNFIPIVLMTFLCAVATAQTSANRFDLDYLKLKVAESQKVSPDAVRFLEVKTFDSRFFVYAKLVNGGKPVTFTQEISTTAGSRPPWISGSITCTGIGCQECDIEGLPDITQAWCNCVRQAVEKGYCNMTKSVGF